MLGQPSGRDTVLVEARAEGEKTQRFVVRAAAVSLLSDMMSQAAISRAVTIIPEQAELTTTQAAGALNISQPRLLQLLRAGKLPHHMTGTRHRVTVRDLLDFVESRDSQSSALPSA